MPRITNLRAFNQTQILHLLYACSHLLNEAFQDTHFDAFKEASSEASKACEYLQCVLEQDSPNYQFH